MSAQKTGRQSPSPERQSGAQQKDAPSSGQGVNETSKNKRESQADINVCPHRSSSIAHYFWIVSGELDN
jgi:hypothetical protein